MCSLCACTLQGLLRQGLFILQGLLLFNPVDSVFQGMMSGVLSTGVAPMVPLGMLSILGASVGLRPGLLGRACGATRWRRSSCRRHHEGKRRCWEPVMTAYQGRPLTVRFFFFCFRSVLLMLRFRSVFLMSRCFSPACTLRKLLQLRACLVLPGAQ